MIKLCVFDFDSTLMDGETIDILAADFGVGDRVKELTAKAMRGELDFFESLLARASLLKAMPHSRVLELFENLPLMKGANDLIAHLNSQNILTLVFSGGFIEALNFAQQKLHFKAGFANFLHHKDGLLTGLVGGEIMLKDSKGTLLAKMKAVLNLAQSEVACVGDGANDLAMFKESGLKIAFCAKEVLKKEADICIDEKDLSKLKGVFNA